MIGQISIEGIGLLIAVLGLLCYFVIRARRSGDERHEDLPQLAPPSRRRGHDLWEGFQEAHEKHPPVWPENDSWHPEFAED